MRTLEHLFHHLVAQLAARDPALLGAPLRVHQILDDILPYQDARSLLGLECSEDYELLVLRLCAGHGDLAHPIDPDALQHFANEAESVNPDLDVLHALGQTEVVLQPEAVARARAGAPPEAPAPATAPSGPTPSPPPPPPPAEPPPPPPEPPVLDVPAAATTAPEAITLERCLFCGGSLPAGREVNFCPHCGQHQGAPRCPGCGADVDLGWQHCISCGRALPSP